VFIVAVPIAALAFLATWLIPQVELKQWPEARSAQPESDPARTSDAWSDLPELDLAVPEAAVAPEALEPEDATRRDP
jgi:hypothetical protein